LPPQLQILTLINTIIVAFARIYTTINVVKENKYGKVRIKEHFFVLNLKRLEYHLS